MIKLMAMGQWGNLKRTMIVSCSVILIITVFTMIIVSGLQMLPIDVRAQVEPQCRVSGQPVTAAMCMTLVDEIKTYWGTIAEFVVCDEINRELFCATVSAAACLSEPLLCPALPVINIGCKAHFRSLCAATDPNKPEPVITVENILRGGLIVNGTHYVLKAVNTNETLRSPEPALLGPENEGGPTPTPTPNVTKPNGTVPGNFTPMPLTGEIDLNP